MDVRLCKVFIDWKCLFLKLVVDLMLKTINWYFKLLLITIEVAKKLPGLLRPGNHWVFDGFSLNIIWAH